MSLCIDQQIISGSLAVPGSKSITNRLLLLSALASGTCTLEDVLFSDDTMKMIEALQQIGVTINFKGSNLTITGTEGKFHNTNDEIYIQNAGTAMRFLTALSSIIPGSTTLTGNDRMQERPIKDLIDALKKNGVDIVYKKNSGYPPITILSDQLPGGHIQINGNISSQYISALLLIAPYAKKPIRLEVIGDFVSKQYVDVTIHLMRQFGIYIHESNNIYEIPCGIYQSPRQIQVEADASSASYPLAAAALTGGKITVTNLGSNSIQGDASFCFALEKMGCEVIQTATTTTVMRKKTLKGIEINMSHLTDTFMTLAVVASIAQGNTKITGIANQRVKECDRIHAMAVELGKCGITTEELPDGIIIHGGNPHGANIECYDDHRIAMSFGILGAVTGNMNILDPQCVAKTYPSFWQDIGFIKE